MGREGTAALLAPDAVQETAVAMLGEYGRRSASLPPPDQGYEDPGPLVLAALLADLGDPAVAGPVAEAASVWVRRSSQDGPVHLGLCERGFGGCLVGLAAAARTWPSVCGLADRSRAGLSIATRTAPWRRQPLGWSDYDLITGPAGTLLALATDPATDQADCGPLVDHLVGLCAGDDLAGLRLTECLDERRAFNLGRVNTGVGHGVSGVALALVAAADLDALPGAGLRALAAIGRWLAAQSLVDPRGVRTWAAVEHGNPAVSADGVGADRIRRAVHRQAWCYGTPGVSWALWEIGRVLDDDGLRALAIESAASLLTAYDDAYLDDGYPDKLGICHGSAGLMLIFDAFDRHASMPGAADLRDHLIRYTEGRLSRLVQDTGADPTLLSGSSGVEAALLTCRYGGSRAWLRAFGLR